MSYRVVLTESFKKCVKQLEKHYKNIKGDLAQGIRELTTDPERGVSISGSNGCWKFRVANSDSQRGKSGGYRLIYFFRSVPEKILYLLLVYDKSSVSDVSKKELRRLLQDILSHTEDL